jgi:hypothetical protein
LLRQNSKLHIYPRKSVKFLLWSTEEEHAALLAKLDAIERSVNSIQMPLAYADQFYVLREHIGFVRGGSRPRGGIARSPSGAPVLIMPPLRTSANDDKADIAKHAQSGRHGRPLRAMNCQPT